MGRTVFLSKQYGTEAGVGGDVDWKKGSILNKTFNPETGEFE